MDRPAAVAVGNFDGLHRGHQAVVGALRRAADAYDLASIVLTFEPHPRRFFSPAAENFRLERLRTKLSRLEQEGIETVVMPRFNADFAAVTADQFMEQILKTQLNARAVVVGENFVFGYKRAGDIDLLRRWGAYNDVEIIAVPPVLIDNAVCSSSAVRQALKAGDMPQAARLLGRSYMLSGRVVHGDARGRTIGFPTANVALPEDLLLPAFGVYAVHISIGRATYKGVANVGIRPTIGGGLKPQLEVHAFDVNENMYGQMMCVFMTQFLRHERKFDSTEVLAEQIAQDCVAARQALEGFE